MHGVAAAAADGVCVRATSSRAVSKRVKIFIFIYMRTRMNAFLFLERRV